MKVLVTGVNGQLGYDVVKVLTARGIEHQGVDQQDFDLTDSEAVHSYIREYKPDAVIHCAAWTAVDLAEDQLEKVRAVNAGGTPKHRRGLQRDRRKDALHLHRLCIPRHRDAIL